MNKLFLVLIAIATCMSCTSKGEYTIKGTAPTDLDGKKVFLTNQREDGVESIDSTEIKGGKFFFKGTQEKPALYVISLEEIEDADESTFQAILLVEPGKITIDLKDNKFRIGGTSVNDAYQKKLDAELILFEKMKAIEEKFSSIDPRTLSREEVEKINMEFMSFEESYKKMNLEFAAENINNPLGEAVFLSLADRLSIEEIESVVAHAGDEFKSKETGKMIINLIERMKQVAIGQKFIDLTMFDPFGKETSLSDYAGKGKYVLLDFWASWCGPCIKEIPVLIEAYKQYQNKNFEIVGVSLDANADHWKAAIQRLKLTWPQMSDLKHWQSQATQAYHFSSIPHTILLDPDGIIIAKDLRGAQLMERLQELIK